MKMPLSKRILLGLTGRTLKELKDKLAELEKYNIKKIALFLEFYSPKEKRKIYQALLSSKIKDIPLVHIRNDMKKSELKFLEDNYNSKCFTIHENSFKYLKKWGGFHKQLFLEMNYDNHLPSITRVEKIGGFCIDLSHFKASEERWTKDFKYIISKEKRKKYFICNHLNGYSNFAKKDLHTIHSLKEFDYLKTLPRFLFGKYIALEMFNSIKEQIKFKKYLCNMLKNKI